MQWSKSDQAGKYSRKKKKKALIHIPERANQVQANNYLAIKKVQNIRISDGVWGALLYHPTIKMALAKGECDNGLAGIADNTCFLKISEKYSLCLHLELKCSGGKLTGKAQKNKAKLLPYQISDNPETTMKLIDEFIKDANEFNNLLKKKEPGYYF